MSDFTAKVGKATDVIISIDEHALQKLEAIEGQQYQKPSLAGSVLSLLNPLSAFLSRETTLTENQLKQLLLDESAQVAQRIPPIMSDALVLHDLFKSIQATLDTLQKLTVKEKSEFPELGMLVALWQRVARPDAYAENQSHHMLLGDLMHFYNTADAYMGDVVATLRRVSAELKSFRDEFAKVQLVMHNVSFPVLRSAFAMTAERLQASRAGLEGAKARRRKAKGLSAEARTRAVYSNAH